MLHGCYFLEQATYTYTTYIIFTNNPLQQQQQGAYIFSKTEKVREGDISPQIM